LQMLLDCFLQGEAAMVAANANHPSILHKSQNSNGILSPRGKRRKSNSFPFCKQWGKALDFIS
ncbi:MAG: hypothetical protein ACI4O0_05405, partial [Candidatus Limivicinus sp.]